LRYHRNRRFRFDRTKNINNATKFSLKYNCESATFKLNNLRDDLIYNKKTSFRCVELTNQELRRSKLSFLNIVKIREGIFKNKII